MMGNALISLSGIAFTVRNCINHPTSSFEEFETCFSF
jgi:hypothetical protein